MGRIGPTWVDNGCYPPDAKAGWTAERQVSESVGIEADVSAAARIGRKENGRYRITSCSLQTYKFVLARHIAEPEASRRQTRALAWSHDRDRYKATDACSQENIQSLPKKASSVAFVASGASS